MFQDAKTLIAAATLLRRYHDSVEGFVPPSDARWRFAAPTAHEVICHNDWSPANALFRGHTPVAMLDWDSAGPGSRAWDVATSVYWWVPLKPRIVPPSLAAKASRFARFCDAYGAGISRPAVLDTLIEQLLVLADFVQAEADAGDPGYSKLAGWHIPAVAREDSGLLTEQRNVLLSQP
jgi:thiamine kinase-like enzyme